LLNVLPSIKNSIACVIFFIKNLFCVNLHTTNVRSVSLFGLFIILSIVLQCLSGVMLAFSLVSEPMLIPFSRDEEDIEDLYTDDFFWIHERGVDLIFMLVVLHFLRKMFLMSFSERQENAWKSGAFLFLILHGVIFFGLVLCCTHLSDITLTIAANIMNTLTFKYGKTYWFLFTDQTLNSDTIIRAMYIHYILGLLTILLGVMHALIMHYDYKDSTVFDGSENENEWFDLVFKKEIFMFMYFLLILVLYGKFFYKLIEPLNFEIFMWGDVGSSTDVRFLGVAPHWYFRSYMSWLLLCPHHYFGVFGLIYLMFVVYFQTNLKKKYLELSDKFGFSNENSEFSWVHIFFFIIFIVSIFYTNSFLPYGRFYNMVGGNLGLLISYLYIYTYLTFPLSIITCLVFVNMKSKKNLYLFVSKPF